MFAGEINHPTPGRDYTKRVYFEKYLTLDGVGRPNTFKVRGIGRKQQIEEKKVAQCHNKLIMHLCTFISRAYTPYARTVL